MTARQAELLPPEFPAVGSAPEKRPKGSRPDPEELFAAQCRQFRLPTAQREYRFAKPIGRQWRFDFAFLDFHLAVEIEGFVVRSIWAAELFGGAPVIQGDRVTNVLEVKRMTVAMGGHATITGLREDCEKYNTAAMLGWTVLRFEQGAIKPQHAIEMTQRVLAARGWKVGGA